MDPVSKELTPGRRLVPRQIDDLARRHPNRVVFKVPIKPDLSQGFRDYTTSDLANAVNRVARWLEDTLGRSDSFETIGYIGPGDIRYHALIVGCVKAGYKLLLNSPRNSLDGHLAVIDFTKCKTWIVAKQMPVAHILAARDLKQLDLPECSALFDPTPVPHYPYDRTYEQARDEPLCVIHTSGSTGLPKPIVVTHGYACTWDSFQEYPTVNGRPLQCMTFAGMSIYNQLPMFHIAGLTMSLLSVIYMGMIGISGPPGPPTLGAFEAMLDNVDVDMACLPPSTVVETAKWPDIITKLKKLKILGYGGAPIPQRTGDCIAAQTKLLNCMGTTESGVFPFVDVDNEDWNYFQIHPDSGIEMRPAIKGFHQMYTVRKAMMGDCQAIFHTFPDKQEYTAGDLFQSHPTKANLYKYEGRSDDVIVLSNGENINPTSTEMLLSSNPVVSAALVVGQGRFQAAVILEGSHKKVLTDEQRDAFVEQVWPTIEYANLAAPGHAALWKDHILVVPAGTFLQSGKGNIQRFQTVRMLQQQIDDLYERSNDAALSRAPKYNTESLERLKSGIRCSVRNASGLKDLGDDEDFFNAGIDSLQVMSIVRLVQAGLNRKDLQIEAKMIYANPSIKSLGAAVFDLLTGEKPTKPHASESAYLKSIVRKYNGDMFNLPRIPKRVRPVADYHRVILTGSTGSLGSYLLSTLMSSPTVKEVWCLNRSDDAKSRQQSSHASKGLKMPLSTSSNSSMSGFSSISTNPSTPSSNVKIHFFTTDLSRPDLGLDPKNYMELQAGATHVIHNAWTVDFNLSLSSFEPHIAGVCNLIALAAGSKQLVNFQFISSVAVVKNWSQSSLAAGSSVPEKLITDLSTAAMGYGKSKLIGENLVSQATKLGLIRGDIVRVGQVAGPVRLGVTGEWTTREWFPSLVEASRYLGMLPSSIGMSKIDWIPVDMLAVVITELSTGKVGQRELGLKSSMRKGLGSFFRTFSCTTSGSKVNARFYHTANPHTAEWKDLMTVVQRRLAAKSGKLVEIVDLKTWVAALKTAIQAGHTVPGAKLVDYYEMIAAGGGDGSPKLEVFKTTAGSPSLRALKAVDAEWMELWMKQWGL